MTLSHRFGGINVRLRGQSGGGGFCAWACMILDMISYWTGARIKDDEVMGSGEG